MSTKRTNAGNWAIKDQGDETVAEIQVGPAQSDGSWGWIDITAVGAQDVRKFVLLADHHFDAAIEALRDALEDISHSDMNRTSQEIYERGVAVLAAYDAEASK